MQLLTAKTKPIKTLPSWCNTHCIYNRGRNGEGKIEEPDPFADIDVDKNELEENEVILETVSFLLSVVLKLK